MTTNYPQHYVHFKAPSWYLPIQTYRYIIIGIEILSLVIGFLFLLIFYMRKSRIAIVNDNENYNDKQLYASDEIPLDQFPRESPQRLYQ